MKKIIFIAPHLSTGGLPQYLYKKIETLKDKLEVFCIEYENITGGVLVVQRNRIERILDGNHFLTLGENKKEELIYLINKINPDFIHLEEIPEYFLPNEISDLIYKKERNYKIFETSHDSSFDPDNRKFYFPDAFFFVSNWQIEQYKNIDVPKFLAEYPIEFKERPDRTETLIKLGLDPNKKHILNVGLFTPRKNQAEIFELAKFFDNTVEFHFLGNQADNFKFYWDPLLKNKPQNCRIWGERNDTDIFYSCMDLFLFTSRGKDGDKETMPLVLREAIGWNIPILLYNLDVYQNYFYKFDTVSYLLDTNTNLELIKHKLNLRVKYKYFNVDFSPEENKISFSVIREHSDYKKYNLRLRDKITGLTFQPFLKNRDFKIGDSGWLIPSSTNNTRNGIHVEFLNEDELIEDYYLDDLPKTYWPPNTFPTTEIFIKNKKINIQSDPNDISSYWSYHEIFVDESYKGLEAGDVVFDIGANIGFFSLFAIKQGAEKVYSFEPIKSTFDYLNKNTKDVESIQVFNLGVGAETKEEEFIIYKDSSSVSINNTLGIQNNYDNNNIQREKVKLININDFIEENNIDKIDYIKIDCEGGEIDFFTTIKPDFLRNKVRKISGEIHIEIIGKNNYEKIKEIISNCNFELKEYLNQSKDLSVFYAVNKSELNKPKLTIQNPVNHSNEIAVLVQSCDAYEKFWEGWYNSMKLYWNWDLKWKIYFLTEEKEPFFSNDKNIEIIKIKESDSKKGFSTRLIKALKLIPQDYVFYFQEDMWPILRLDQKYLLEGFNMLKNEDWNCLRIQERLWGNISLMSTNYFINNTRVLKYKNHSEWSLAHHPSIWKKDFYLDNLIENEDPWTNEIYGTRRIYDKYLDTKIYHLNVRWYYQPGASQNGNMNPYMEEYSRNLKLTEQLNKEFNLYG